MRASTLGGRHQTPSEIAGDTIDMTPVMNVFLILIPFLVSMAVFSHLAVHRFSLPADEGHGQAQSAHELPLTIVLSTDRVRLVRGDRELVEFDRPASGFVDTLGTVIRDTVRRIPTPERVVVVVDDPVLTRDVVACLDACRAAGFDDVALASGTSLTPEEDR